MARLEACWALAVACAMLGGCAGAAPVRRERIEIPAGGLLLSIVEDYERGEPRVELRAEHWGERVKNASGEVETLHGASADGSSCLRYSFQAELDSEEVIDRWHDSGLEFVSVLIADERIEGQEGVSLAFKAEGCAVGTIRLRQQAGGSAMWFATEVVLNGGSWQEPKIPFAAFAPGEPRWTLDPRAPVTMEMAIPYVDNWERFAMRTGTRVGCGLSVDNVGFYRSTSAAPPGVVETFDDDVERLRVSATLYGTSSVVDYSGGDEGVSVRNSGVSGQSMRLTRKEGGEAGTGRYLCLDADLELTGEIGSFIEQGQGVALFMTAPLLASLAEYATLSFAVRSELVTTGTLELQDVEHEGYYDYTFPVSAEWTRVSVPFREWAGEQGNVEDSLRARTLGERPRILFSFELPGDRLVEAGKSRFHMELGLDDFLLEDQAP